MKNFILVLLSLLLAHITWRLYNLVPNWDFTIAFLGGAISMMIVRSVLFKD